MQEVHSHLPHAKKIARMMRFRQSNTHANYGATGRWERYSYPGSPMKIPGSLLCFCMVHRRRHGSPWSISGPPGNHSSDHGGAYCDCRRQRPSATHSTQLCQLSTMKRHTLFVLGLLFFLFSLLLYVAHAQPDETSNPTAAPPSHTGQQPKRRRPGPPVTISPIPLLQSTENLCL